MKIRTQSKKVNKAWMAQHVNDPFVQQAQKDGYRARAAYKLKEIDEALRLLAPGQVVVDLGSAPGAWSQYVRRRLGARGTVLALDLLPMAPIAGVQFIEGDFGDDAPLAALQTALAGRAVDVVLSDMAPNLSGIAATDDARIQHLVELALDFAGQHLQPRGALVAKVFHGGAYEPLAAAFKARFTQFKAIKPAASRAHSAETFLFGRGLR